jgi:hypothetical protein
LSDQVRAFVFRLPTIVSEIASFRPALHSSLFARIHPNLLKFVMKGSFPKLILDAVHVNNDLLRFVADSTHLTILVLTNFSTPLEANQSREFWSVVGKSRLELVHSKQSLAVNNLMALLDSLEENQENHMEILDFKQKPEDMTDELVDRFETFIASPACHLQSVSLVDQQFNDSETWRWSGTNSWLRRCLLT